MPTVPKIGSRWVWEIDKPHACELIEVTATKWNGGEGWVAARPLYSEEPLERWNDLDRWWEAATPVGDGRGHAGRVQSVGLCPEDHTDEYYMPDAVPGDRCPYCERELVIYAPLPVGAALVH